MRIRETAKQEPAHDWENCRECFQQIGFTIGIKSGDVHIADTRVCEWDCQNVTLVKMVELQDADEDDVRDALSAFDPYDTRYFTDTASLIPVSDSYITDRINIHEQRTVGFLFNLIADPKISKAAKVWCKKYGLPVNPATAVIATWAGSRT